ncbi:hypothetical protein AUJ65_02035 [Candidatus Micrarchaeota archaeon CG1_02_51_15]|nr:MAG: hypothetical protein AUJ65_02035 [Candidatus Micrarchaeota archaeon CG1_02_51_15]
MPEEKPLPKKIIAEIGYGPVPWTSKPLELKEKLTTEQQKRLEAYKNRKPPHPTDAKPPRNRIYIGIEHPRANRLPFSFAGNPLFAALLNNNPHELFISQETEKIF